MKKNNFSVIKLLIFLIFFLIILTTFLLIYILPEMKKYKTNQVVLKRYEKLYEKKQAEIKLLENKKKFLQKKYSKDIKKYETKFNIDDFKKILKNELSDLEVTHDLATNTYILKYSIENMQKFYNIIDKINKYKTIIKATFPIVIKRDDKLYKIKQSVTILHR